MKIFHISDTHGSGFWDTPLGADIDVVVHSGDAFPNSTRGHVATEQVYQSGWLKQFVEPIRTWLNGRPFIYVPGNHDYIEFADFLPAHRIDTDPIHVAGKSWRGFRQIPWIRGEWAGEIHAPDMQDIIESIFDCDSSLSAPEGDVLVCHSPPAGVFDASPNGLFHYGISALSNALQYRNHAFKAVLFGHVHQEKYCQMRRMGIIFSNAADNPGGTVELP